MTALREGFTTGSCAAAAALGSCLWRRNGECPDSVQIELPGGRRYTAKIHAAVPYVCGVVKDAGDDPDVTNGCMVTAEVEPIDTPGPIVFQAGEGVGIITLPGLKLPVGEAAINPVPRQMIGDAVRSVYGAQGAVVTVSIPDGRQLAGKTFNPRLGIEGGLSILGTSGIVRPMSEEALKETIRLEMSMRRAQGARMLGLVFGGQGERVLRHLMPETACVQMSNFVGYALDEAAEMGFEQVVLCGQPGKLAKVSAGIMQTHSRYADGRRETITAHLALMGAPQTLIRAAWESVTLEGTIIPIQEAGYAAVWDRLCDAAAACSEVRVRKKSWAAAVMTDAEGRIIGRSERMRKDRTGREY